MPHSMQDFFSALQGSLLENSFVKLTLAQYKGAEELKTVDIRKIIIKRQEMLSFTYHYKTRDIVKNHTFAETPSVLQQWLTNGFGAATLYTTAQDLRLEKGVLKATAPTQKAVPSAEHDRAKQRLIVPQGKSYLQDLNITDAKGIVFKNAQDKFRQINKYVEVMSGLIKQLPQKKLKIVDMGSGKGYLTFALYDYAANVLGLETEMVGVEFRADMVKLCNQMAQKAGFTGLSFVQNSIADYDCAGADIVIALHACDTATDDALYKAITADAALIVVAPCCHKQVRREMERTKTQNALDFLMRHGTFVERQAEMVTDGLRAQLLEYQGYATKVFEFISDAHTPKNVMIVATKDPKKKLQDAAQLAAIQSAKAYFGIGYHHLERKLGLE